MEVSRKDSWSELQDFYRGKRVLVTGHTGFKGSWLVRILMNMGADVTGYALKGPTDPCLFDVAGLPSLAAKIAVNVLVVIINYILSKLVIFHQKK